LVVLHIQFDQNAKGIITKSKSNRRVKHLIEDSVEILLRDAASDYRAAPGLTFTGGILAKEIDCFKVGFMVVTIILLGTNPNRKVKFYCSPRTSFA